jgi:hypothetical protein
LGGVAVFRGHIRRSGSLRSVWHRRERKRLPLDLRPVTVPAAPPPPTIRSRYQPTEAEWLSGDSGTMLRCLIHLATNRGIVFHMPLPTVRRKLRLYYCACCRLLWDILPVLGQQAVETVERYVDGLASAKQLRAARRTAEAVVLSTYPVWTVGGAAPGAWDANNTARLAVIAANVPPQLGTGYAPNGDPAAPADRVALLRDLFENPFRPTSVASDWLTPTVVTLARVIHANRAFHLMPVLGDALQDAGCTHAPILEHCSGPGPHAAGCWLLDRLTGRDSA